MTPEELKERGRRIAEELFNQGDLSVADELIDRDYTQYIAAGRRTVSGLAAVKDQIVRLRQAFPDLRSHVDEQIAEGDTLVQRLTVRGTHAETGREIEFDLVDIARVGADGTFVARWSLASLGEEPPCL
ncbi:ester cyclase [Nonomuraea sp. NPDC050536]|uniref:ester cyclase n=1 Tax=Nonomuraea sp. NPDC050536 TaxID=3364366 RepID=UPI0037CB2CF0